MRQTRRCFALLVLLIGLLAPLTAAARQTPTASFADLGLPEIAVTITDTAIEGAPAELTAGRYVLSVTNDSSTNDPASGDEGVGFLQPPDGMTAADFSAFIADMSGPPEAGASPEASPAADAMAEQGPPSWYYEVALAGGVYALPGQTASTVLDLTAGEWVLWTEDPAAPQPPVGIVVTGDAPADQPTPDADVTITASEMMFTIDPALKSGPQTVAFTNGGEQPHFLGMSRVPAGTTVDDVLQLSETYMNPLATPPANLSFEDMKTVIDTADLSPGMTTWFNLDLEPGSYLLVCFVPDRASGIPHAMLGMIDIVTVE